MRDPLYRKDLLRLAADAAGAGRLAQPDASATAHNPACGDRVTMDVRMKGGHIAELAHQTQASAAILGGEAAGMSRADIQALADQVAAMLQGGSPPSPPFSAFAVFDGVAEHKGRHVCVMLPFKAVLEALADSETAKLGA